MTNEIHGFLSPSEYQRFVEYIENQVTNGVVKEVDADPNYGEGRLYGGRWFEIIDSGDVWRLIQPDFPFKGLWMPVKRGLG